MQCRITRIPKGNGKFRVIYNPDKELRQAIKAQYRTVVDYMMSLCDYRVCHGFMPGRSPSTNASYHIGYQYTLSMDLKDFFDTVTREMLLGKVPGGVLDVCIYDGAARQGLPTSPALANIAAADMDEQIDRAAKEQGMVYTRYADDLTISGNDHDALWGMRDTISALAVQGGFVVNERKTSLQSARGGRRMITGAAVDDRVHVPRRLRRKARAATHQGHLGSAEGLVGWAGSPKPLCPICWRRCVHQGLAGILMHFRWAWPTEWIELRGSSRIGQQEQFLLSLAKDRGGIIDYADMYDAIRNAYIEWSMRNG